MTAQRSFAGRPPVSAGSFETTLGALDVSDVASARRSGLTRYRLEIFPPGTNSAERRQLRQFRQWRLWGAVGALVGEFLAGALFPGWQGPLFIAVVYLTGLLLGLKATSRLRRATRSLNVATVAIGGTVYIEGDLDLLESCVTDLERLEAERRAGRISPVAHESSWAELYARLAPDR